MAVLHFIGDIGGLKPTPEQLAAPSLAPNSDVCYLLGDNVYPYGVPPPEHKYHAKCKAQFLDILSFLCKHVAAHVFVLPGNHDYNKGQPGGESYWQAQVEATKAASGGFVNYLPVSDFIQVQQVGSARLICLNTQALLQPGVVKRKAALAAFFNQLHEALASCVGTNTLVLGHHPVHSRALHGGHLSLRQHLFPLTLMNTNLVVPVPVVGSLVALGRRYIGTPEDMAHRYYRRLRTTLLRVFAQYQNLVYISGHDHNLQMIPKNGNYYVVSGSGSKTSYVRPSNKKYWSARTQGGFCYDTHAGSLQAYEGLGNRRVLASWQIHPMERL